MVGIMEELLKTWVAFTVTVGSTVELTLRVWVVVVCKTVEEIEIELGYNCGLIES